MPLNKIKRALNQNNTNNRDVFWDIDEEQILSASDVGHYEISLEVFFNAQHYVTMKGNKGIMHAHSYRVRVRCLSSSLDKDDHVVIGYAAIRDRLTEIVKAYNNQLLNDLPPFKNTRLQTTTENLSAIIFQQLERSLKGLDVRLIEVAIWESPTNAIAYRKSARYIRHG